MKLTDLIETPSSGLSDEEKSKVAKKAKKGEDIFHGGFKKVEDAAAEEYGSKKAGERVAAAVMWKKLAAKK
jgi:hypothetical protein